MPPSSDAKQESTGEQQDAESTESEKVGSGEKRSALEVASNADRERAEGEEEQADEGGEGTGSDGERADSDGEDGSSAEDAESSDMEAVEIEEAEEVTIREAGEEPEESATVLHVLLEGLHVNILGLEIHLPELDLDVSAVPGKKRLLGNLLSQVVGLLDGVGGDGGLLSGLRGALGKLRPSSILGGLKKRLASLLPFVGGGQGESAGDESAEAETGDESSDDGEESSSEGGEGASSGSEGADSDESEGGLLRSIGSRLWSAVGSLLPSIPIEKALTWLVQTSLERLVDAADKRAGGEGSESGGEGESEEVAAADGGWVAEANRMTDHPATGRARGCADEADATMEDTDE